MFFSKKATKDNLTPFELWLHFETMIDASLDVQRDPHTSAEDKQMAAVKKEVYTPLADLFNEMSDGSLWVKYSEAGDQQLMRLISVDNAEEGHLYSVFPMSSRADELYAEFLGINHNGTYGLFRYEIDGEYKPLKLELSHLIQPIE